MARDPPSMAHDVAYRDLGGPSARCVITVHTDASAASECEVFVERWSARTSSDRSPGTLSKDPASTATTAPPRVESWRVVVRAGGSELVVPLPEDARGDDDDAVGVRWSKKTKVLTVTAALTPASSSTSTSDDAASSSSSEARVRARAEMMWTRAGGVALLSSRGSETAESRAWRETYVRERLSDARRNVAAALRGGAPSDDATLGYKPAARGRKKDAPRAGDKEGVAALRRAQAVQRALVAATAAGTGRRRRQITETDGGVEPRAVAKDDLAKIMGREGDASRGMTRREWTAPSAPPPAVADALATRVPPRWSDLRLYPDQHPHLPRRPLKRVVLDGFASDGECRNACGAAIVAMEGLDVVDGECALAADDLAALAAWGGPRAADVVDALCRRTRRAVEVEFAEPRSVYLAGALLTRLTPRGGSGGRGGGGGGGGELDAEGDADAYDANAAHVDKANIASYDYSAVLYLNAPGACFDGGEFVFRDGGDVDEVVLPAVGRLLLFASGAENLHQVRSIQTCFTHRSVSTLDRVPFQLTGELFLYGMALR